MPFANNQGIRIHYETIGQGPPLVMQYGQYFPLDIWHEHHYVAALQNDFRLILVDARGHGASDKPHHPEAYRVELMVNDILTVVDDLGIEKMHYWGYSSGGYLGFAIAFYAIDRCRSLILGGSAPFSEEDKGVTWKDEQIQALERQTTEEFVANLENFIVAQSFPAFSSRLKASMLKHDTRALIAWLRGSAIWQGFDDFVGSLSIPCLLYAGENTEEYAMAKKNAQAIPGAAFVTIPGGDHLEGGTWIDILHPHVDRFLKGVPVR